MLHPGPSHQGARPAPPRDVPSLPTALPVIMCPPTLHTHPGASVTRHTRATATKLNFSVVTKDDIGQLPAFKVFHTLLIRFR